MMEGRLTTGNDSASVKRGFNIETLIPIGYQKHNSKKGHLLTTHDKSNAI